jgi:hypothetical protein
MSGKGMDAMNRVSKAGLRRMKRERQVAKDSQGKATVRWIPRKESLSGMASEERTTLPWIVKKRNGRVGW